jgi:aspartate/glutamate racemase
LNGLSQRESQSIRTSLVHTNGFQKERLRERFGIDVLVPREDDMTTIHQIIYDKLCKGRINTTLPISWGEP